MTECAVATNSLEILEATAAGAASIAVGADLMLASAKVKKHTFVQIVNGHAQAGGDGAHYVCAVKGDETYEVYVEGKGKYVIHSDYLLTQAPKYNRRPTVRLELPAGPRHGAGGKWTAEQNVG